MKQIFCVIKIEVQHQHKNKLEHIHEVNIACYVDAGLRNIDDLRNDITQYLNETYYDQIVEYYDFHTKDNLTIAEELYEKFDLNSCTIIEDHIDGSNGVIVGK